MSHLKTWALIDCSHKVTDEIGYGHIHNSGMRL
jgi:hypothetical protein